MPKKDQTLLMDDAKSAVLDTYAAEGANAACLLAGVSRRTVQRWAAAEGIESGYTPLITRPCPSAAAYARGCRCDGCKEANKVTQQAIKERRIRRFQAGQTVIGHGVSGYSNWDCRCATCKAAWSEYLRGRRSGGKSS